MRRRILLGGNGGKPPVPSVLGVYAFFYDGSISQATSYTTEEKANIIGVLVIDNYEGALHKIVIDKTYVSATNTMYYGGYNKSISGATTTEDETIAIKDMKGKENTIAISKACHGYNDGYRTGSAAEDCRARFGKQGHLPSVGEWKMLYNNKSAINTMMSAIGGKALQRGWHWSSTLYNASTWTWYFYWDDSEFKGSPRDSCVSVRAVLDPETYVPFPKTTDTPGVYAYFKDGSTSQATSYTEAQKANIFGVLVVAKYPTSSDIHKIVLDKTNISANGTISVRYGGYNKSISASLATVTSNSTTALKDMNGKANTIAISGACYGYNDGYRTGSAAEDCQARFGGQGHLPSIGEWKMLYDNKSAVDTMMSAIGGTVLQSYYWSSTLRNSSTDSWYFHWDGGHTDDGNRGSTHYVRAVLQLY